MARRLGDYIKLRLEHQAKDSDPVTVARDEETDAEWEAKKVEFARRGFDIVEDRSSKPSRPVDLVKLRMASQPADSESVTVERATESDDEWEAKKADFAKRGYEIVEDLSYKKDPETKETDSVIIDGGSAPVDSATQKRPGKTEAVRKVTKVAPFEVTAGSFDYQKDDESSVQAAERMDSAEVARAPRAATIDTSTHRSSDPADPTRYYGNDPASAAALRVAEAGVPVEQPGLIDRAASFVSDAANAAGAVLPGMGAVNRILTPGDVAPGQEAPTEQQVAARQDSAPLAAPPLPQPVAAPPGRAAMQLSSRTKSGVSAPAAAPYQTPPDMEKGARMAMDAVRLQADVDKNRTAAELSQQEETMRGAARLEEQRQSAFNAYEQRMSDGESAIKGLMAERRELMKQGVDPGRYWANKDAGSKFAAVVAGAMFGWTGQGMQWLNRLDKLVNDDVKLQQDELARKGGILDDLVGDQKNLVAMGRQRGLDNLASVEAAKAAMYEQAKAAMEHIATSSKNEGVKANAMANIAAIQMEQDKRNQLAMEHQKRDANEKSQIAQGWAKLRQNEELTELKLAAKSAGGQKMQELKPSQQKALSGLLTLRDEIGRMSQQYKDKASSVYSPVTAGLGLGMQVTDASQWDDADAPNFAQSIGTFAEGGKLTDADYKEKYLKSFIPRASDTNEAAANKTRNLVKYATEKYKNELAGIEGANAYIRAGSLPSPQQYEAMLLESAGMGGPLKSERKLK